MDSAGQRQQHKTAFYFVLIFFLNCLTLGFLVGWGLFQQPAEVQKACISSQGFMMIAFAASVDFRQLSNVCFQSFQRPWSCRRWAGLSQPRDNSPWHCRDPLDQESSPSSCGHDLAWRNPNCHSRIKLLPQTPLPDASSGSSPQHMDPSFVL